jgi:photosystem II stability/assembly factor-like uncharacterized protein
MILALLTALAGPAHAVTWNPIDSGVDATLIDLHFHDAARGVAVGTGGAIILTQDGGDTWIPATSVPSGDPDLHGVSFGDALHGVAVGLGGAVWWTSDGGWTWNAGVSGTTENLFEVAMVDSLAGYAVGWGGTILATIDGGATWSPLPSGTTEPLWGISLTGANTAVAVGDYTILRTADGGESWSAIPHPMTNSWLYDVAFADSLHGLAVGDFVTVLRTADGGLSWTLENNSDNDADFFLAVAMRDTANALAVGWFDGGARNALRTRDGGSTWEIEATGYARSLRSVVYREGLAIATGLGGLLFKTDEPTAVKEATFGSFKSTFR